MILYRAQMIGSCCICSNFSISISSAVRFHLSRSATANSYAVYLAHSSVSCVFSQ